MGHLPLPAASPHSSAATAHATQAEVPLLTPDILVCSVGTEILIDGGRQGGWGAACSDCTTAPTTHTYLLIAAFVFGPRAPRPPRAPPDIHTLARAHAHTHTHAAATATAISATSTHTQPPSAGQPDAEWEQYLNEGWDRHRASAIAAQLPELLLQAPSEQRSHKISYKLK